MTHDLQSCKYLPNVKTLNRKFGGLIEIRKLLGVSESDLRIGGHRSQISKKVGVRGFSAEQSLYEKLVKKFHEPYVHNQSRVVVGEQHLKLDFVVYHSTGKFAVDIFYPESERGHFSTNVSIKYSTYKNFLLPLYLVVANEIITQKQIDENIGRATTNRPNNVLLIRLTDFIHEVGKYQSLSDPYTSRDG